LNVFTIVFDGIRRRKIRSILSVIGIAIAAMALFTMVSLREGYETAMESELDQMGAHVVALAKGCPYEAVALIMMGGEVPDTLSADVVDEIEKIPNVAIAAPNALGAYEHMGEMHSVAGITPKEKEVKPGWEVAEGRFPENSGEVMLGSEKAAMLAEEGGFDGVGEQITVSVDGEAEDLEIVGILGETASRDDNTTYTTLEFAQRLFDQEDEVITVNIQLNELGMMDDTVEQLEEIPDVQAVTVDQVIGTVQGMAGTGEAMLMAVLALALLIGGLGTMNTMLMTVFERTREVALMKAMGASDGKIFNLFLMEGVAICLVGSFIGIALGGGAVWAGDALLSGFLPLMPSQTVSLFSGQALALSLAFPVGIGVLSAVYPALRASRLEPVEALKNE